MPMLYRVSNDVSCKNTEALLLLRDFNLIVPSSADVSRSIAPAVAEALECLWQNDVLTIDQAAAKSCGKPSWPPWRVLITPPKVFSR